MQVLSVVRKWFLLAAAGLCLVGVQQAGAAVDKKLTLGCLAYSEPMVQWIKEGLEPLGYQVKIMMFDANQLPATALKDGNLDGIIANHRPWILTFNRENDCHLEMVKPYYFHSFFAIYSTRHKNLEDIPNKAQIAVPGDPTNMSRSLIILEEAGLITLGEKTDIFYTVLDIKDNPKDISIIETEITQTARSINDVDAIIATAYFVSEAGGIDPASFLFEDPQNKDYALGLIVRDEDLEAEWAKLAMDTLHSEPYRKKFQEHFKGKYTLYP
ncbi:MetQ/NlpA family ABC transporter substrate-binding protein [Desulfofustis glycolicus]|uniref:D-methionine transport system substrate-binding protein n=1 Tax=Desulfofustis glycolicus DSM 9705 TaxID=1121409 RepID=A0A1M5WQF1_9BACT|nr:MetQ/NlpA family ABC transporter substrate-binding protein [Desulfofustis glycolicus]MCB2218732.1 hypothetical protein [Desulfobulbaceae bacterium]SHH89374.1 D-methionine transport system substrate-binding protein [Desulfofustis glycolicus DSM 9705]